ncbi:hypothetical protein KVR01_012562 [Diaporthe batatas]|uniref:uncharacterized protein n=1 Tax=Diaporthe batatas TaxID=748121 RepID=UPI001D041312|nr:uncharacterized protein KVR01_012562 [Diaporthe batatas]KAG8157520.1 hypothetical protein KVR01_012562 [Diaporthe batatas]
MSTSPLPVLNALVHDYPLRRLSIGRASATCTSRDLTWPEWIERESQKRTLCATHFLSNLLMVIYDMSPGFLKPEDLEFEMPDEERLWNARTEGEWHQLRSERVIRNPRILGSVLADVMSAEGAAAGDCVGEENRYDISAFTALFIMHAVSTHLWMSIRCARSMAPHADPFAGALGGSELRRLVLSNGMAILSRCHRVLSGGGREAENQDDAAAWDHPAGPLLFNCHGVLRIACSRLLTSSYQPFQHLTLITNAAGSTDEAAEAYAASPQERNDFFTKVISMACQSFLTPVQAGHMLVRKTAALSWGVEHAVAGWDSVDV